jgi:Family of unknown function (DUF6231)
VIDDYLQAQSPAEAAAPRLLISPSLRPAFASCLAQLMSPWHWHSQGALPEQRFAQAWVDLALDALSLSEGRQLLGQVRNLLADQIWVITQSPHWSLADFMAMGFQQDSTEVFAPAQVFTYSLHAYNHKRSWNNAKYWANPQNFHRYRW